MSDALIFRSPVTLSAPGDAPFVVPDYPVAGAVHRHIARVLPVGATVDSLPDFGSAGLSAVQATAGKRPTIVKEGGIIGVKFDGVDDFLQVSPISNPAGAVGVTIVSVLKFTGANGTVLTAYGDRRIVKLTAPGLKAYSGTAGTASDVGGTDGAWHVVTAVYPADGTGSFIEVDGAASSPANLGNGANSTLYALGAIGGGNAPAACVIAEQAVFRTVLSSGDRAAMRAALKAAIPGLP